MDHDAINDKIDSLFSTGHHSTSDDFPLKYHSSKFITNSIEVPYNDTSASFLRDIPTKEADMMLLSTCIADSQSNQDITDDYIPKILTNSGWMQYETPDGVVYYFNHDTDESQWNNPYDECDHDNEVEVSYDVIYSELMEEISQSYEPSTTDNLPHHETEADVDVDGLSLEILSFEGNSGPSHNVHVSHSHRSHDNLQAMVSPAILATNSNRSTPSKSMMTTTIEVSTPMQVLHIMNDTPPSMNTSYMNDNQQSQSSGAKPMIDDGYMTQTPSHRNQLVSPSTRPISSFITPPSKSTSHHTTNPIDSIINSQIKRKMSFSSMSDVSDEESNPRPDVDDHDMNSISSSDFTDRHLRIWNKFFENALKSKEIPKLKKSSSQTNKVSNKKIISDSKLGNMMISSPSRTPRSVWPPPMKDADYHELLQDFFDDSNHLYDKDWLVTVMMASARKGDAISIAKLLSFDIIEVPVTSYIDEYLRTPAHYCAKNDDAICLGVLYDSGVDIEAMDMDGRSPIHVCCLFGSYDALKFLLESAVDVDSQDHNHNTALHFAARGGYLKQCKLLLEYGASSVSNDQRLTAYDLAQTVDPRSEAIEEVLRLLIDISPSSSKTSSHQHSHTQLSKPRHTSSASMISSSTDDEHVPTTHHKQSYKTQHTTSSRSLSPDRDRMIRASYDYEETIDQVSNSSKDRTSRAQRKLKDAMMVATQDRHKPSKSTLPASSTSLKLKTVSYANDMMTSRLSPVTRHNPASPPPWFDLMVDTSVGKPPFSPSIPAHQKSIMPSTSPIHLPMPNLLEESISSTHNNMIFEESKTEISDDDSDYDDDGEGSGRGGVIESISNAMWSVTDMLLGITLSMFVDSKKNKQQHDTKSHNDSHSSLLSESSNQSDMDLSDRTAPPTDSELRNLSLDFHPKPPDFVAAELREGVEALRTGRTPKREYPMVAPLDVSRVVNIMREEADRITYTNDVIDIQDIAHNPFLLTPRTRLRDQHSTSTHPALPKPLFGYQPMSTTSASSSTRVPRSPPKNAYSVGNRLPEGVAWRYVDVFNNPDYMK